MGSGLFKLTSSNRCVETRYNNVHEIQVLDHDRNLKNFSDFKGKKILFFTVASGNKRTEQFIQSILNKKPDLDALNIEIVGLTTNTHNHEKKNFEEQKTFYEGFGIKTFPGVSDFFFMC